MDPVPALPLVHQEAMLMASWPPLPGHLLDAGLQPFALVVPSVPLKLYSLSMTMQRATLSVSHVFNCATLPGIAQAALPPPVVPTAKPSGFPTTAYVARSPMTAALAEMALPSARMVNFILEETNVCCDSWCLTKDCRECSKELKLMISILQEDLLLLIHLAVKVLGPRLR